MSCSRSGASSVCLVASCKGFEQIQLRRFRVSLCVSFRIYHNQESTHHLQSVSQGGVCSSLEVIERTKRRKIILSIPLRSERRRTRFTFTKLQHLHSTVLSGTVASQSISRRAPMRQHIQSRAAYLLRTVPGPPAGLV